MYNTSLIVDSATNGASIPVCMVAAIMVFAYKLHRKTVYRLALYQVLTAEAMAGIHVIQVVIIDYYVAPSLYEDVCKAFAYLTLFVEWAKLLLSTWVTLHLFVFAVFHKNLRRCEAVYVVTSLAIPALIASLPFATSSYGLAGSWCWIKSRTDVSNGSACYEERVLVGTIEQFALWYGPSLLLAIHLFRRHGAHDDCARTKDVWRTAGHRETTLPLQGSTLEGFQAASPASCLPNRLLYFHHPTIRLSCVQGLRVEPQHRARRIGAHSCYLNVGLVPGSWFNFNSAHYYDPVVSIR